jgi:hypothetical protein
MNCMRVRMCMCVCYVRVCACVCVCVFVFVFGCLVQYDSFVATISLVGLGSVRHNNMIILVLYNYHFTSCRLPYAPRRSCCWPCGGIHNPMCVWKLNYNVSITGRAADDRVYRSQTYRRTYGKNFQAHMLLGFTSSYHSLSARTSHEASVIMNVRFAFRVVPTFCLIFDT